MAMKIIFRVDGNKKTGMGHISRCVALAKYIRSVSDSKIIFVVKDSNPSINWIKQAHFSCCSLSRKISLKQDACKTLSFIGSESEAAIVTDIPRIDSRYLEYLKAGKGRFKLVCLDSYGIKKDVPHILINPTLIKGWYPKWNGSTVTRCFFGPDYWILDEAYLYYHGKKKGIENNPANLLISMGGSDAGGLTLKIINTVTSLDKNLKITAVLGPASRKNAGFSGLIRRYGKDRIRLVEKSYSLAKLMSEADIGILAAGFTLYEAAYMGLPCLAVSKVLHQLKTSFEFNKRGIAEGAGLGLKFNAPVFIRKLENIISSQKLRRKMSLKGQMLVDGKGVERVWELIKS